MRHEKSLGHRREKIIVISHREIYISRHEKGHGLLEIFHGMENIYSLREHHSPTVNVVVLLNHATYGGTFQ